MTVDGSAGSRFVDFSFAGTTLAPGSVYTVRFVETGGSARGGWDDSYSDPYAGGIEYFNGSANTGYDLRFRVTAVPEPGTWALLGVGAAGAGFVTLRRRRVARG